MVAENKSSLEEKASSFTVTVKLLADSWVNHNQIV